MKDTPSCSIERTLSVVGERWTFLVLREVLSGRTRFAEIRDVLGVAPDMLSDRLAGLVEHGVLAREPYQEPGRRTRYAYRLTPAGRDLAVVLGALQQWGMSTCRGPAGPPCCAAGATPATRCTSASSVTTAARSAWTRSSSSGPPPTRRARRAPAAGPPEPAPPDHPRRRARRHDCEAVQTITIPPASHSPAAGSGSTCSARPTSTTCTRCSATPPSTSRATSCTGARPPRPTPASWPAPCSWPGRARPTAGAAAAPPTPSGWCPTAARPGRHPGRHLVAARGRPPQREHPPRLHPVWVALVGDPGQPRGQAAAARALLRGLRLRPGQDPDRPAQRPLPGRHRQARRPARGRAAPGTSSARTAPSATRSCSACWPASGPTSGPG